ncbi:MAG: efflux RND transporter periplasmic adaptor subunit, partial [Planctomycetota bacterium]
MPTIAPPETMPVESPATQHDSRRPATAPSPVGLAGRLTAMRRGAAGMVFLGLGAAAWWWLTTHHFGGGEHESAEPQRRPAKQSAATASGQNVVVLPPTSQLAADIGLTTVEVRPIRDLLTVPGRLDYDARSRLDYASPVDGIVSRVFVTVRQKVTKGDSLAEVSSPDVGMARDDIRKREDDRQIAKKAADWAAAIADNVETLLNALASQPPLQKIEADFRDRLLGSYREKILGSYSRLLFVEKVNASTKQLGEGGVLSGRLIEERTSNLEVAKANFTAVCEEALFMTRQDRDRAKAALEQADRLVRIAREHLRTLVGSRLGGEVEAVASGEELPPDSPEGAYDISSLVLRTPF